MQEREIEMVQYNGQTFRNILEARWALFFDELHISYRYETKQYVFEEVPIQPDFFLPRFDSFVKIKEKAYEGTLTEEEEEELEGIKLLTLYTGKYVYILAGNVWLPGEPDSYDGFIHRAPELYTHLANESLGGESTELVKASIMVKLILQKLDDCYLEAIGKYEHLELHSKKYIYQHDTDEGIESYREHLLYQHECLEDIGPLIMEHFQELVAAITPKEGYQIELIPAYLGVRGFVWVECSSCGNLEFHIYRKEINLEHYTCKHPNKGTYKINTHRLMAAYSAARQGNFDALL